MIRPTANIEPYEYIGKDVVNTKGDNIGVVIKLVLHTTSQETFTVVHTGKFMGVSGKQVVFAIDQLQPQENQLRLDSDLTRLQLAASMEFESSEFSEFVRHCEHA